MKSILKILSCLFAIGFCDGEDFGQPINADNPTASIQIDDDYLSETNISQKF